MSEHTYTAEKKKKKRRKTDRLMRTMTGVLTHTHLLQCIPKIYSNREKETMKG